MALSWFKKRNLPDHQPPCPPHFLRAVDLFARRGNREIFIKKIYSSGTDFPQRGSVIMAPGLASNANLYRIETNGRALFLDHNRSFANLLASEGFTVYLYHPGYTERVHNRYVRKHCRESIFFGRKFKASSSFDFSGMVDQEIPLLIDFIRNESQQEELSWIGFSMGGMLMYAYLSRHHDSIIRNVITIGSPITLNQIFVRLVPYTNTLAGALGFEERTLWGTFGQNMIPLTRVITKLPKSAIRLNPATALVCNPFRMHPNMLKSIMGKIIEPIPPALERSLSNMISVGTDEKYSPQLLTSMRQIKKGRRNFLFFLGTNDLLAPVDSVCLAHEVISPEDRNNLVKVQSAGHLDLILGRDCMSTVWAPCLEWLQQQVG